ncbi:MAG: Mth938-like domain-containing protein [Alphaproteobacteria bacterium]|nr:Mth938-like domain-containing protein [Alphaproteobacteria bacterium]
MAASGPPPSPDRPVLHGYGAGGFRISGQRWQGAVLILPDRVLAWPVAELAVATPESLAALLALEPGRVEVLIVGTGAGAGLVPKPVREALAGHGIGVEVMNTGAACRTLAVLTAEGRRVAGALLPV